MAAPVADWTGSAGAVEGPGFERFQRGLAAYNARRLNPGLPHADWRAELADGAAVVEAEGAYVEAVRAAVSPLAADIPDTVDGFISWFENLKEVGPGQGDPLFPWLASQATHEQMTWFVEQELAGEAGFEDLLALTQVKFPEVAKLEMARNYWDEMGRGQAKGMHGPMLHALAVHLDVHPTAQNVVPESLALGNTMIALAMSRRYAFHAVGALGVIELTAPGRSAFVNEGLKRLGVSAKVRHYFALHAVLDVKHSQAWNREIVRSLVAADAGRARAIGEGALMRLHHGARCFARYRERLGASSCERRAA